MHLTQKCDFYYPLALILIRICFQNLQNPLFNFLRIMQKTVTQLTREPEDLSDVHSNKTLLINYVLTRVSERHNYFVYLKQASSNFSGVSKIENLLVMACMKNKNLRLSGIYFW